MEESKARAAGGAAQEAGLGFAAALFMGEDRIGDVWVRPQPFPRPPSPSPSQSQPQSWSQPQPQPQLQRPRQYQQQQQQHQQIKVKDDGDTEEERERRRTRDERARIAFGSEIRVASLSPPSERCPPLSVLHTISPDGVWFKLNHSPDSKSPAQELSRLHRRCITEAKTAVVMIDGGATEVHLAAVKGGEEECHFWAFAVTAGLYHSSLAMLNTRCLAMVFDLDETLILANTMRSFEDRMEALKAQMDKQRLPVPDNLRLASLNAELKRFQDDRAMLKCYIDNDYVIDASGRIIRAQPEEVSPNIIRPVVRIPEQNLILTRINPSVRDTSVLVKVRPGWEELRSYIVAKGRKRFEVFICTMSERDYALEMWRLLDTGGRLIESRELQRRLLCVKSGSQKSLSNMLEQLQFHPKLAMVIDDRLDVWEDKDRAHVHWVPPYAPYTAPQAEINCPLPVLCATRNVACNVRGAFFKEFDELLQGKLAQLSFDTDVSSLPWIPSVAKYLNQASLNGSWVPQKIGPPDGIAGAEVKNTLYPAEPAAGGWIEAEDEEPAAASDSPSPSFGASGALNNGNGSEKPKSNGVDSHKREPVNGSKPPENIFQRYEEEARILHSQASASEFISAFEELGKRCNARTEFRCAMREEFSAEAFIDGENVGQGVGQSNKEAKSRAAEDALRFLANISGERVGTNTVVPSKQQRTSPSFNAVAALKDMCNVDDLEVFFSEKRFKGGYECEVEVEGQILGRGSGRDVESARQQAAEQALKKHLSKTGSKGSKPQKRSTPPPIIRQESSKRFKSGGENWRSNSRNRVRTPPRKNSRSRR